MKAFSLFKVWAVVALFICTSNVSMAAEDAVAKAIASCKATAGDFPGKDEVGEEPPNCTELIPVTTKDPSAEADRRKCVALASCMRSAKSSAERVEGKCDTAVKDYRSAIERFEKSCSKTGVGDCLGAARDCENKRTDFANSGSFSDTLNNAAQLFGMAYLNNRQALNSQSNLNALNKCPQLSYSDYFSRKKELDEKIDKKTRDLEKNEEDILKKKDEISEAKRKADEAIKELDEKIAKNKEELTKDLDEAKRKALDEDNKRMQAERDLIKKIKDTESEIALVSSNAAADARLMRQRVGLDPSARDVELGCMSSVKSKYEEVKAAMTGAATKKTKDLKEALLSMFKKCKAEQDLKLKSARTEEAKKTAALRAELQKKQVQIDEMNKEITTAQNQGILKKQMDEQNQQNIQTNSTQKESNLQAARSSSAATSSEKIKALQDSIGAQGTYAQKAYNLRVEIAKAQQELAALGPVPTSGFESSSYSDSASSWDRVLEAEESLRGWAEKGCADAALLVGGSESGSRSYRDKYNKRTGGSGSASGSR